MKILFYSSQNYDKESFEIANEEHSFQFEFLDTHLNPKTALLANGYDVVCVFVNDDLGPETIKALCETGVKLIALRCAGYNNVDLEAAKSCELEVVRVPAYSPYAVAEHACALVLTLNRKTHKAFNRTRESNFKISGLRGFDMHGKTVGIIGCGKIGEIAAKIFNGFGMKVLVSDPEYNSDLSFVEVVNLEELLKDSDIISLHCPLNPKTKHMINAETIKKMKDGVMLINTSRGALIDTKAVINGLKSKKIGYLGIDVYEEEADLFFEDHTDSILTDDVLIRLLSFPNVLVTGHQAFFTNEAISEIAEVTLENIKAFSESKKLENAVIA